MNFSFFLEQAKYTAIYTTMKLKTISNKWFSSLSLKNDNERKKEKGHLVGYYMTHYTLATKLCLSKWPLNYYEQPRLFLGHFLVVNRPEIALTLEKCLIQGKIIVCFP